MQMFGNPFNTVPEYRNKRKIVYANYAILTNNKLLGKTCRSLHTRGHKFE